MCKTKKELNTRVAELREALVAQKLWTNQVKSLKADIIEYVEKHGTLDESKTTKPLVVVGDTYILSYGHRVRTDLDREKLKDVLGESYAQYVTETPYMQLDVK